MTRIATIFFISIMLAPFAAFAEVTVDDGVFLNQVGDTNTATIFDTLSGAIRVQQLGNDNNVFLEAVDQVDIRQNGDGHVVQAANAMDFFVHQSGTGQYLGNITGSGIEIRQLIGANNRIENVSGDDIELRQTGSYNEIYRVNGIDIRLSQVGEGNLAQDIAGLGILIRQDGDSNSVFRAMGDNIEIIQTGNGNQASAVGDDIQIHQTNSGNIANVSMDGVSVSQFGNEQMVSISQGEGL